MPGTTTYVTHQKESHEAIHFGVSSILPLTIDREVQINEDPG
jgi:hypothetical protein